MTNIGNEHLSLGKHLAKWPTHSEDNGKQNAYSKKRGLEKKAQKTRQKKAKEENNALQIPLLV